MSVTLPEAKEHLNIRDNDPDDDDKLSGFVEAANEWVGDRVTDTTTELAKLGIKELVRHWWSWSQLGPASSPFDDDISTTIGGLGYGIPNRVVVLLGLNSPAAPTYDFPDAVDWPDPVEWPA